MLALGVFLGVVFFLDQSNKKGAIQITSEPKSKVYINGKLVGETPFCKCEGQEMLSAGEYTIRLEAAEGDFPPYEEKIPINPSVLTVMDRIFGKGALAESKTITLTNLSDKAAMELLVISFPQDADVFVDSNLVGKTPLNNKTLSASDHEVRIVKDGYREKTVRIRTVPGYKLIVIASLGILPDIAKIASDSASHAVSIPTPVVSKIVILNTPTGFLRVRKEASLSSAEIARVSPGDSFDLIEETAGWFKIKLEVERQGWVSSQYARKE